MFRSSTIQLLRFHFSFFLLPVYLFALSQLPKVIWSAAIPVFIILHLLVYPSSNGYNSYMDRDETPIGGLKNPKQPTRQLFYVTIAMDVLAVLLSLLISTLFALGILIYILASRAYSYRGIRLKQYAVAGFLTVFIFQGAFVFFITWYACGAPLFMQIPRMPMLISSLLIGALYPLTQIYQHAEDVKDGVCSISYVLGKKGTFILTLLQFLIATGLFYQWFQQTHRMNHFFLFLIMMLPVVLFFLLWMSKVWRDESAANFKNSLIMNLLSTLCTTAFFLTLNLLNH